MQPAISQGKLWDLRGKLDLDLQEEAGKCRKANTSYRVGMVLRIRCLRTHFRDTDVTVGRI